MARPWLPRVSITTDLYGKAQVRMIAAALGVEGPTVVGLLGRLWLEAQVRADAGGTLRGKSAAWVDALVGRPGFAAATVAAGWIRITPAGVEVVNFDEWVSRKAQQRLEKADRQAERRGAGRADGAGDNGVIVTHSDTCGHKVPVVPDKPKAPRARKPKAAVVTDVRFWKFWRAYPEHRAWDQPKTYAAWVALAPDDVLVETIVAALEAWKASPQWRKDNGEFVPASFTWLAGRRWQDRPAGGRGVPGGPRLQPKEGGYNTGRSFSSDGPPAPVPGPDPDRGGAASLFPP